MNDDVTKVSGPLSQMPGADTNSSSSIDDYQPPQDQGLAGDQNSTMPDEGREAVTERPVDMNSDSRDLPDMPHHDDPQINSAPVDTPAPTAPAVPQATASSNDDSVSNGQSLEDQNIFFMLGVTDGSEEERESFLDELQEVIWEDFLEKDVELLITQDEAAELKKIQGKTDRKAEEIQEEIVVFLEKLIPDLEEIMLEKALELKEDMFRERIADMKDYYKDNTSALEAIASAEQLMTQDKWKDAAAALNAVKS